MVANPTDNKEYPAPENCEKCNQSLLGIQGKSKVGQEYTLPKMEPKLPENIIFLKDSAKFISSQSIKFTFPKNGMIDKIATKTLSSEIINLCFGVININCI